jgi:tRNA-splicing ligase RtcB
MEKLSNRLVSWASLIDEKTVEQARTSSTMPFIYPHLALMPDAHLGLGATVGSVIPTHRCRFHVEMASEAAIPRHLSSN